MTSHSNSMKSHSNPRNHSCLMTSHSNFMDSHEIPSDFHKNDNFSRELLCSFVFCPGHRWHLLGFVGLENVQLGVFTMVATAPWIMRGTVGMNMETFHEIFRDLMVIYDLAWWIHDIFWDSMVIWHGDFMVFTAGIQWWCEMGLNEISPTTYGSQMSSLLLESFGFNGDFFNPLSFSWLGI